MQHKRKNIPSKVRAYILERDEYTCQYCGVSENLVMDHVYPVSKGGTNSIYNLQTLCNSCNSKKWNKIQNPLHEKKQREMIEAIVRKWNGEQSDAV